MNTFSCDLSSFVEATSKKKAYASNGSLNNINYPITETNYVGVPLLATVMTPASPSGTMQLLITIGKKLFCVILSLPDNYVGKLFNHSIAVALQPYSSKGDGKIDYVLLNEPNVSKGVNSAIGTFLAYPASLFTAAYYFDFDSPTGDISAKNLFEYWDADNNGSLVFLVDKFSNISYKYDNKYSAESCSFVPRLAFFFQPSKLTLALPPVVLEGDESEIAKLKSCNNMLVWVTRNLDICIISSTGSGANCVKVFLPASPIQGSTTSGATKAITQYFQNGLNKYRLALQEKNSINLTVPNYLSLFFATGIFYSKFVKLSALTCNILNKKLSNPFYFNLGMHICARNETAIVLPFDHMIHPSKMYKEVPEYLMGVLVGTLLLDSREFGKYPYFSAFGRIREYLAFVPQPDNTTDGVMSALRVAPVRNMDKANNLRTYLQQYVSWPLRVVANPVRIVFSPGAFSSEVTMIGTKKEPWLRAVLFDGGYGYNKLVIALGKLGDSSTYSGVPLFRTYQWSKGSHDSNIFKAFNNGVTPLWSVDNGVLYSSTINSYPTLIRKDKTTKTGWFFWPTDENFNPVGEPVKVLLKYSDTPNHIRGETIEEAFLILRKQVAEGMIG